MFCAKYPGPAQFILLIALTMIAGCGNIGSNHSVPASAIAAAASTGPVAINSGGGQYTSQSGVVYQADTDYSGGFVPGTSTATITGTSDPTLYQTERYGKTFSYNIPLANGNYNVTLKFAEIYWNSTGQRVFNVSIQGTQVITNLDIYALVGKNAAYDVTFPASVTNGTLNIGFTTVVDNAKISAIAITPAATVSSFATNSGGGQYTSQSGVVYQADTDYSGGFVPGSSTATITGTSDPTLYQTERYGKTFSYNIPLANGNYNVTLKFAEIYWNSAGQRVFNVSIQGMQVITNLDIYALVGKNAAYDVTFPASVTNGTLNIGFTTVVDNAKISAIAITPAATVSSFAANSGGGQYTSQSGVLYQADTDYSGGTPASTTATITGTSDPTLYQTERYGKTFSYNVPLANGNYNVTLRFAEIYWNSSGQRVFNVSIQGTQVITNLDIYALVGKNAAYDVTLPASVTNGTLNIGFTTVADNAKISAIEITPASGQSTYTITASAGTGGSISPSGSVTVNSGNNETFTIAPFAGYTLSNVIVDGKSVGAVSSYTFSNVTSNHTISATFSISTLTSVFATNAGGGQYTAQSGVVYQADTDYSGGTPASTTANITGTPDPALYQTERYGKTFSYNVPLANGNYDVTLKFAEIYWNSSGKRVFNVSIQGAQVITNLDLYALVGKNAAYDVTFPASVTNGFLNIGFTTVLDNAKISAIEIAQEPPKYNITVLHSFSGGADGGNPSAGLLMDGSGNLYGTTTGGGAFNNGTAFKIDTGGNETVLHSFSGGADGGGGLSGLITDGSGNLYGTSFGGGAFHNGTVYKLDSSGNETVLYSFSGGADGGSPAAGLLMDSNGNLYGTTYYGGIDNCYPFGPHGPFYCGTVFKLDANGNETVLHSFTGPDGDSPESALIMDKNGNLYGTTYFGGAGGAGTVFKMDANGNETLLYSFPPNIPPSSTSDPAAGVLMDSNGNLYGTTWDFNTTNGEVYKLDTSGNVTVLHNLGPGSFAVLIMNGQGNLYGTTLGGGAFNHGTAFKLDQDGNETVLYSFSGGADGANPYAGLIMDSAGNLYGTTSKGGAYGNGTVFKLSPQ